MLWMEIKQMNACSGHHLSKGVDISEMVGKDSSLSTSTTLAWPQNPNRRHSRRPQPRLSE
jgi:hypothetical protein